VLLADLDGLKETNDRDGHEAGNELLRAAARGLTAGLRGADELARIGGDEFALLTDLVTEEDAEVLARRLEVDLAARGVPASVGWALFPVDGGTSISLYRRADERLYRSKSARKARAEVVSLLPTRAAG
jgi:diguanylate cyclase (GGDEF)-like protein